MTPQGCAQILWEIDETRSDWHKTERTDYTEDSTQNNSSKKRNKVSAGNVVN